MSMLNKSAVFVVGAVMAVYSQFGFAVGFGRSSHSTTLGQSLEMVVPITADSTEQLTNDCLSAEVLVGDTRLHPSVVRSRLDWLGESGARVLRVSTSVRIDEPVVTVTVAAGCPPRLTRQFVLFIDPPAAGADVAAAVPLVSPEAERAASSVAINPVAETGSGMPAPASTHAEVPAAQRAQLQDGERPRSKRVRAVAPSTLAASGDDAVALVRKPLGAKPPRAVKHVARLQLEPDAQPLPAVPTAASAPELMASAASAAEAAASEAEAVAQRQREALQSLQKQMEAIKAQADTANKSIAQMQSSLRETQESSNRWLLVASALAAAVVALLAWVVWLLRQRATAAGADAAWWNAEPPRTSSGAGRVHTKPERASDGLPSELELPFSESVHDTSFGVLTREQGLQGFADSLAMRDALAPVAMSGDSTIEQEAAPFLTADELIDLGQQTEFFVALGQDDSAVALLEGQLPREGGGGPWPYLKLLEIHRRRDDRVAFERVRERFERRFGVSPAEWRDASAAGRSLDGYGGVVKRIEGVWADPGQAMGLIETLMVRGDANSQPFDLAALGDLQSLYLLARSLIEPAQTDSPSSMESVDLLLPLDLDLTEFAETRSLPTQARPPADSTIDFNLDLSPPSGDTRSST